MKAIEYYQYRFLVYHDNGSFFINVISNSKESAINTLTNQENCPKSAINFVSKQLKFEYKNK